MHLLTVATVNNWISENWDEEIEWRDPSRWDETMDELETWATIQVQSLGEPPTRHTNLRRERVRVIGRVYCRSTTDLYGSLRATVSLADLLRHTCIELVEDSSTYGYVTFNEPTITVETEEERPAWQIHQMVIEGDVQETS